MGKCTYDGCDLFPYYGVAPHECYWRKPGGFKENKIGESTILPKSKWPDNFVPELEEGDDPENPEYGLCGVYYCPKCKSGMPEND